MFPGSVSSHMPRMSPIHNMRVLAAHDCVATMLKVTAFAIGFIAAVGCFVALGPIAGLVSVICTLGLFALFHCSRNSSHNHTGQHTWFMYPQRGGGNGQPQVQVGGGHFQQQPIQRGGNGQPQVQVGGGHFPQQPVQRGGHIQPGGGHFNPPPNRGGGNVQPGGGHMGQGQPLGHGNLPPPTGPNGHVGVGMGHF